MMDLTPELVARAVLASATHYGDDPERALTAGRGVLKRSLRGAAIGLHRFAGGGKGAIAKALGVAPNHLFSKPDERALKAADSVVDALTWAAKSGDKLPAPKVYRPSERKGDRLVDQRAARIIAVLPKLFAAHPDGATATDITALTGLTAWQVSGAMHVVMARKLALWTRIGRVNAKVLLPWQDPALLRRPKPVEKPPEVIPQGPKRQLGGKAASIAQPARFHNRQPAEPVGSLRGRILALLSQGDATAPGIATMLDVKESFVGQTLIALEYEGVVRADPPPEQGRRYQRWRLREEAAA